MTNREITEHLQICREALISEGVWIDDPTEFPGLVDKLDPSVGLDAAFHSLRYDTRLSTGTMVRCAVCPQRQRHHDGFIIRTKSGDVGLVGNVCGALHFGASTWEALEGVHRVRMRRTVGKHVREPAVQQLAVLEGLLKTWSEDLQTVDQFQADCLDWFYDATTRLKRLPDVGWFFDGQSLATEARKLNEQTKMIREKWSSSTDLWTGKDREMIQWLSRSIMSLHRKHDTMARSIDAPNLIWGRVATEAGYAGAGARFFFNPDKRAMRVKEPEGGGATLTLPTTIAQPPDLNAIIEAMPDLDD